MTGLPSLQRLACLLPALALLVSGCSERMARTQLEKVAKGWCETIRASQVIPVYPLTEDLLVGDVFLVQTPIADQASIYRQKGFLPLDDAQVRLRYTSFTNVYFNGFWDWGTVFGGTPHPSLTFTNAGAFSGTQAVTFAAAPLPRAAFPTYSFKAQSGFGLNAAFPIQGVPVALSYLNTDQVDGSVTIADARTYAGDQGELLKLLNDWRSSPDVKDKLADIAYRSAPDRVFLRVVSRVYYARAVDVTLSRSASQSVGGKGGTVSDVNLMTGTNTSAPSQFSNTISVLNSSLALMSNAVPQIGASAKFVGANSSIVGLSQSFDRLLAIGYLGFDVEVFKDGSIGSPIPTFDRVTQKTTPPAQSFGDDDATPRIRSWLQKDPERNKAALRDWLKNNDLADQGITVVMHARRFAPNREKILKDLNIP